MLIFLSLAAGVLGYYWSSIWLLGMGLFWGIGVLGFWKHPRSLVQLGLGLLCILGGYYYTLYRDTPPSPFTQGQNISETLRITSSGRVSDRFIRFSGELESGERIWLYLFKSRHGDTLAPELGSQIQVWGRPFLRKPAMASNPYFSDYDRYQGISDRMVVSDFAVIEGPSGFWLSRLAEALNRRLDQWAAKSLPDPYSRVLLTFTFGDKGRTLPPYWTQLFRELGLTHLLVVSGSQVALLSGTCLLILRQVSSQQLTIYLSMSLIHLFFYVITGGGASILRAIIMAQIALLMEICKYRSSGTHIFVLCLLVMLLIQPSTIMDIGAHLSVAAAFSLLFAAPRIFGRLPEKWPMILRRTVATSLAPFLLLSPLLIGYFHQFSWMALPANLLVVGIGELLVMLGFFSSVLGLIIPTLGSFFAQGAHAGLLIIEGISNLCAAIPYSPIYLSVPHITLFFLFILMLYLVSRPLSQLPRWGRWLGMGFSITLAIYMILPNRYLEISVLDVGQGDAVLISTPNKTDVLLDTGPANGWAEVLASYPSSRLTPLLNKAGINKLDLLIISHMDLDHVGGLHALLKHIPVAAIGIHGLESENLKKLLPILKNTDTQIIPLRAGQQFELDTSITIDILAPIHARAVGIDSENNRSVAFILRHEELSFLFTGDIEKEEEWALAEYYGSEILHAPFLKLGHHGSNSSTLPFFLNRVAPSIAVASSAYKNKFKHPTQAVQERLRTTNVRLFRTDIQGTLRFRSDGKRIWKQTEYP